MRIQDITIIIPFSIRVASVIGNFKAVPRQAHWIEDFEYIV
jgi:hypothetical protein